MIDPPAVPSRGRMWSHLASDTSFDELHAFARELGIPERGFDRDHYDVPSEWYDQVLALGVEPVSSRELVTRLVAAGLRRRKRVEPPIRLRPASGDSHVSTADELGQLGELPLEVGPGRRPPTAPARTPCGTGGAWRPALRARRPGPAAKTSSGRWAYSRRTAATYSS